jgi:hypothetical protein
MNLLLPPASRLFKTTSSTAWAIVLIAIEERMIYATSVLCLAIINKENEMLPAKCVEKKFCLSIAINTSGQINTSRNTMMW